MAAIQNDRDVLLQAAPVRVVPTVSEVASVRIVASGNTFIQDTELTPTTAPVTIVLTAELTNLTGTVTWSVISGTATLSYTGNTCTVNGASAALGTLIVKASITDDGKTYTDQAIITKIKDLESQMGREINSVMNTGNLAIRASETTVRGSSPTTITLTAVKGEGLTGTVTWSRFAGTGDFTPATGDSTTITTSSMSAGSAATFKAALVQGGRTHEAYVTISKLGLLSNADQINLSTQVTGSLSSGNVSGLGALAHLNSVNLRTQTTGALNGLTQVTNLGTLAYANSIAANQIGAGTLAAGVIYSGTINANNITSGTITGRTVRTASSGTRSVMSGTDGSFKAYTSSNSLTVNIVPGNGYAHITGVGNFSRFAGAHTATGISEPCIRASTPSGIAIRGNCGAGASEKVGILGHNSYAVYAEKGTIGPFTAGHDVVINKGENPEQGDILIDQSIVCRGDIDDALCEVVLSTVPNQPGAVGAFDQSRRFKRDDIPAAARRGKSRGLPIADPAYWALKDTHCNATTLSVGEGHINVCGEGGDISIGDLIVTSSMRGKGMKQADDIVRAYTVAKAREARVFTSPSETAQIACIYLCG